MDDNNKLLEIQRRLILANNAYYSLLAVTKSRMVCKFVKIRLYKTLICMVLMYGCKTLKLSKKTEDVLNSFERDILRRICGLVGENGSWRIRYNEELYREYKDFDLVSCIKFK
jgi:cytochrome c oxidase assembly protein Cox11